jgi:hypothetical protein
MPLLQYLIDGLGKGLNTSPIDGTAAEFFAAPNFKLPLMNLILSFKKSSF